MNKDQLVLMLERPIAFHPGVARAVGSVSAGLFLCQLLYWSGRGHDANGWIYKTADAWEVETTLTRDQQRTARSKLRSLGVLHEKQVGMDPTLHFRIDFDVLHELLFPSSPPAAAGGDGEGNTHVGKSQQLLGTPSIAVGSAANCHYRDYSKTTTTSSSINIDELCEASLVAERKAGRVVRNEARFLMMIKQRVQSEGLNESDVANIESLRQMRQRATQMEQMRSHAASATIKTPKPPLPRAPATS